MEKQALYAGIILLGGVIGSLIGIAANYPTNDTVRQEQQAAERRADNRGEVEFRHGRGRVVDPEIGAKRQASLQRHSIMLKNLPKATAPAFDLRDFGLIPPVVDQGMCGSCWDFSGTGMVTVACIKAGYGKNDGSFMLSEQYTLDCGRNGGCQGDDNITVLADAKAKGLPTTADYGPYRGGPANCKSTSGMRMYRVQDWGFCTPSNQWGVASVQDIKNCLVQFGAIGSAVAASSSWDGYRDGVHVGNNRGINHDVIIVGWVDTPGKYNGGYWIMRNSWGKGWGNAGYMNIAYGSDGIGTEAVWATAIPLPPPPPQPIPPDPTPPPTPPPPGPVPPPSLLPMLELPQSLPAGRYKIVPMETPSKQ